MNLYKVTEFTTNDPIQNDIKLITSIVFYLVTYQDTSHTKPVRHQALASCEQLLSYIVGDVNVNLPRDESQILESAFMQILTQVKLAQLNIKGGPIDFSDSIGFLRLLIQIKNGSSK